MSDHPRKSKLRNLVMCSILSMPIPLVLFALSSSWFAPAYVGLPHSSAAYTPPRPHPRPLIIYSKPRKTGSTFIASKLGVSVLRSGGRVAPCDVSALMTPGAEYYGLVQHYDLLGCHMSLNRLSVKALSRLPRQLVFVTSIREPLGWFVSAAVWVHERQQRRSVESALDLKRAVDSALNGSRAFAQFRRLFWGNYGVEANYSRQDVQRVANLYGYVIDHGQAEEDVDDMLTELGYTVHAASLRREGLYEAKWWAGYRRDEIDAQMEFEKMIYDELGKVRMARKGADVPWAKVDGVGKVVYGAAGKVVGDKTVS